MNKTELKKLFDFFSVRYDIGTFPEFLEKMKTIEQRKSFFNVMSSKNYDLGDYNEYERRLGDYDVVKNWNNQIQWKDKTIKNPETTEPTTKITSSTSSTSDKTIYRRNGDPYEYYLDNNQWYAKRKDKTNWVNISIVPAYQSSVDILNKELEGGKLLVSQPSTTSTKAGYSTSGTIKDASNIYKSVPSSDTVIQENIIKKIIRDSLLKHVKE